ncbi:PAS domain-containing protein, partial [Mitsuaria sp. WAJ17]|uniref:PAS domain S-box protein n=1 Tax=Mitsuaria sp. WAJ17 TaxID=2761452 RepID=UPI0016004421
KRYTALIDGLQEAVWLVEAETRCVVAVNRASTQLLGMEAEQLLGCSMESLASTPEDAMFWMDVAGGSLESLHTDTMMRHADGRMLWVARRISYVEQQDGDGLWLISMRDQTSQRQHDDERE